MFRVYLPSSQILSRRTEFSVCTPSYIDLKKNYTPDLRTNVDGV